MEKVKRKFVITQEEYEDLTLAIGAFEMCARRWGNDNVGDRFLTLFQRLEDQLDEQGGFEE